MPTRIRLHRYRRTGFTLIELLTVIAIIAVLTGILFPVFATAREQARKGQCQTNMKSIIQGLAMYKDDWRVYPDALFGYNRVAATAASCPVVANATGELEQSRLYPDYVKDWKVFNCPNSTIKPNSTGMTLALNRPAGQPFVELRRFPNFRYCFHAWDSYNLQLIPNTPTGTPELRYNRKWTPLFGVADDRRQLLYRNPPDDTVVTWCLYHSGMNSTGQVPGNGIAIVGFLSGRVQTIPFSQLPPWSARTGPWQVTPKP